MKTIRFTSYPSGYKCNEPCDQSGEYVKAEVAAEMLEALRFYIAICGNTAYSVTRESAQEAYAMGSAAIAKAEKGQP